MAASACAYVHCFVALGRTLRAAYPRDREEASRDVITSTMAFVHVLHEEPVRDTITGGSSATGG
jgi:hypothetical protein